VLLLLEDDAAAIGEGVDVAAGDVLLDAVVLVAVVLLLLLLLLLDDSILV
jgi:hypothetical protein